MSEILVNTIKKADGTGGLTVPSGSGTVATLAGGTFTGDITMSGADLVVGSNSIFIGGTGSANELSDFEEGTWTPTIQGSNTSGTYTPNTVAGLYTKIGDFVCIEFSVNTFSTASGGSGYIKITGMPFNKAGNSTFSGYAVMYEDLDLPTSKDIVAGWNTYNESAVMLLYALNDNTTRSSVSITGVGTSTEFSFSAVYKAA